MDLTKGNITKVLLKFAIPIIILQVLNQAYSLIDSVIVSRFAGGNEYAILSNTSTLTLLGYCLVQGGAIASNVVFAKLFGSKDYDDLSSASKTFNITILIYGGIIALLYCLFARQLLELIQIPDYLLDKAIASLIVYALNFIPVGVIVINESILTGFGDSKSPMWYSIIFQLMNLVLDYIVVAILNMGLFGAALASLLASICSAIAMFIKGNKIIKSCSNNVGKFSKNWLTHSIKLAIPSTISQSVSSFGSFALQIIVNSYGIEIINGYSIGLTLNNLVICPILGLTIAYESFAGQNIGAKQVDRLNEGFKKLILYGLGLDILATILSYLLRNPLTSLFIADNTLESYSFTITCFMIMCGNYFALYLRSCFDSYFKSYQKMGYLAFIAMFTLAIRIVLSFALTKKLGPSFLAWACVISNTIGFILYIPIYLINKNKLELSIKS